MSLRIFFVLLLCIVSPSISSVTILAIGKTGLGKSFTATLFGCKAKVRDTGNSNSTTKNVTIHKCGNYNYIDTPGFDDSDRVTDDYTIINIVSTMQKNKITDIHTLFWFVNEDTSTTSLQNQAKFIDGLGMSNTNNVWNNVIVVYKGLNVLFKKNAIIGAITEINNNADITKIHMMPVYLYEAVNPEEKSEYENIKGIYKKEELLNVYENIIKEKKHKHHPIQIVFNDATCIKCGIKTDLRLKDKYPCHTKVKHKHDEKIETIDNSRYEHPGYLETEYDSGWEAADAVIGDIPFINLITKSGKEATKKKIFSCCGKERGSS
ncbi:8551_t:CDS:2, partial [Ambispora leptoticha]